MEELKDLYYELEGAYTVANIPSDPRRERSEIYVFALLKKIKEHADELGLHRIAKLAEEARRTNDAEPVLDAIRQSF